MCRLNASLHHMHHCSVFRVQHPEKVGGYYSGGPPVPIPNTAVKPACADDTCLETDWKNRSPPTSRNPELQSSGFFLYAAKCGTTDAARCCIRKIPIALSLARNRATWYNARRIRGGLQSPSHRLTAATAPFTQRGRQSGRDFELFSPPVSAGGADSPLVRGGRSKRNNI